MGSLPYWFPLSPGAGGRSQWANSWLRSDTSEKQIEEKMFTKKGGGLQSRIRAPWSQEAGSAEQPGAMR